MSTTLSKSSTMDAGSGSNGIDCPNDNTDNTNNGNNNRDNITNNSNSRRNDGRRNMFSANEKSWSEDKLDIGAMLALRTENLDKKHSLHNFMKKWSSIH